MARVGGSDRPKKLLAMTHVAQGVSLIACTVVRSGRGMGALQRRDPRKHISPRMILAGVGRRSPLIEFSRRKVRAVADCMKTTRRYFGGGPERPNRFEKLVSRSAFELMVECRDPVLSVTVVAFGGRLPPSFKRIVISG